MNFSPDEDLAFSDVFSAQRTCWTLLPKRIYKNNQYVTSLFDIKCFLGSRFLRLWVIMASPRFTGVFPVSFRH